MNWGKWIIVAFILFAGFIATLVTVCMRQEVSLVSKEYYQDELAYQQQITRINNTNLLSEKPLIRRSGNVLEIEFKEFSKLDKGQLKLFRPSDSKLDKVFSLEATPLTRQTFSIDDLARGMYRAQMKWEMNGQEYYVETIVNI